MSHSGLLLSRPLSFFSRAFIAVRVVFSHLLFFLFFPLVFVSLDYVLSYLFDIFIISLKLPTYEYGFIPLGKVMMLLPVLALSLLVACTISGLIIIGEIYILNRIDSGKSLNFFEAFMTSFKRLWGYFSYLYHLFVYVYLIPLLLGALMFIAISANVWIRSFYWQDIVQNVGSVVLLPLFIVTTLIFIVLRGPQVIFSPFFLIADNNSGKESVNNSIQLVGRKGIIRVISTVASWCIVLFCVWFLIAAGGYYFADVPYTFRALMLQYFDPYFNLGVFELLFGHNGFYVDVILEIIFASLSVSFFYLYFRCFQLVSKSK